MYPPFYWIMILILVIECHKYQTWIIIYKPRMSNNVEIIQNDENGQIRLYNLIKNSQSTLYLLIGLDGLLFLKTDSDFSECCINLVKNGGKIKGVLTSSSIQNADFQSLIKLFTEIRYLDKIEGIVATSESEFVKLSCDLAGDKILKGIYSNDIDFLPFSRHSFETLFANASSADLHQLRLVNGIEDNSSDAYFSTSVNGPVMLSEFLEKSEFVCIYSSISELLFGYQNCFDIFKELLSKEKNGMHKGIRWLTTIRNKNDIHLVNTFSKIGIKIRHINDQPSFAFALSNKSFLSNLETIENGKLTVDKLFINDNQTNLIFYQRTFEKLWDIATEYLDRENEIQNRIDDNIEVIHDSNQVLHKIYELFSLVKKDILIILPSTNGFYRTEMSGGFKMLNGLGDRGIKIRVLTIPDSENIPEVDKIKTKYPNIHFRDLEQAMMSYNRIIVFDIKNTVLWEVIDDLQQKYTDALGMALFIESKKITETITIIFNSLWSQSETHSRLKDTHENLKSHGKMQSRFMDLVAHELRTPLQSILGITELLKKEIKNNDQNFMLRVAMANAKKLQRLSENILDITRLEGNILYLNKELFNINHLAMQITSDLVCNVEYNKYVAIEYINFDNDYIILADKFRIGQVIQNLIDNSMRFVRNRGKITLRLNTKRIHSRDIVELSVEDNGEALKPEILSKLFTKFASDSYYGPGIGLYLCRKIVEAHGGRIWAKNNLGNHGCTFTFGIPI